MEYRKFEKLGVSPSLLGFGCMRFPQNTDGTINEKEAQKLLDTAIKAGVNYIDTAYPYHNGESEPFLGRTLKKYPRESFYLATKLPMWDIKTSEDVKKIFYKQLERLQTDYVDFYLIHCLDKEKWQQVLDLGVIPFLEDMKQQGKIRFLGFSFHDDFDTFKKILTYRDWDFCQIQYNYMDTQEQAGDKGYALAESLGVPLVIMEPIKGGSLANFSEDINDRFHKMDPDRSVASYALRWVGSHPNVKVILSGMSTMDQVEDNLKTFLDFSPLSEAEEKEIESIVTELRSRVQNGCTGCRYCMPCPAGVNIPGNFKVWNDYHMYRTYDHVKWSWEKELKEEEKAKNCIKCGKCETLCPQKLSIRDNLVQVQKDLDERIFK